MLLEKDILVRGLAHPVVTGDGSGDFIASIQDQYKSTTEHAMEFKVLRVGEFSSISGFKSRDCSGTTR